MKTPIFCCYLSIFNDYTHDHQTGNLILLRGNSIVASSLFSSIDVERITYTYYLYIYSEKDSPSKYKLGDSDQSSPRCLYKLLLLSRPNTVSSLPFHYHNTTLSLYKG